MFRRRRLKLIVCGLVSLSIFFMLTILKMAKRDGSKIHQSPDQRNVITTSVRAPEFQLNLPKKVIHNTEEATKRFHLNITPEWQRKLHRAQIQNRSFYLAVALQVRIYNIDKAKLTLNELKQWIHYVLWAGVEHIFLCDHYKYKNETLRSSLHKYINSKLVTYLPWKIPRNAIKAKVRCYQYIIDNYKSKTQWQMAIDMDEYPYVHGDTREGFLIRFLRTVPKDVTEVSMPNYLMLGQGDRSRDMLIERITRIKSLTRKSNSLDKPIYRPRFVRANLHHNILKRGTVQSEAGMRIKCLHYWGARLQNWGPDINKTLQQTESFLEVRDKLGPIIRDSLLSFGEENAFSNNTGP